MFQRAGIYALDNNENCQMSEWMKSETSHSRSIMIFDSSISDWMSCVKATIINQSDNSTDRLTFSFCKAKGEWQVLK